MFHVRKNAVILIEQSLIICSKVHETHKIVLIQMWPKIVCGLPLFLSFPFSNEWFKYCDLPSHPFHCNKVVNFAHLFSAVKVYSGHFQWTFASSHNFFLFLQVIRTDNIHSRTRYLRFYSTSSYTFRYAYICLRNPRVCKFLFYVQNPRVSSISRRWCLDGSNS